MVKGAIATRDGVTVAYDRECAGDVTVAGPRDRLLGASVATRMELRNRLLGVPGIDTVQFASDTGRYLCGVSRPVPDDVTGRRKYYEGLANDILTVLVGPKPAEDGPKA